MQDNNQDPLILLEQLAKRHSDGFFGYNDIPEEFELIEEGDWELDFKYQYCTEIFQHTPTGRFFQIQNTRSGSYHTDWYYQEPDVTEVQKVERVVTQTITEWKQV